MSGNGFAPIKQFPLFSRFGFFLLWHLTLSVKSASRPPLYYPELFFPPRTDPHFHIILTNKTDYLSTSPGQLIYINWPEFFSCTFSVGHAWVENILSGCFPRDLLNQEMICLTVLLSTNCKQATLKFVSLSILSCVSWKIIIWKVTIKWRSRKTVTRIFA